MNHLTPTSFILPLMLFTTFISLDVKSQDKSTLQPLNAEVVRKLIAENRVTESLEYLVPYEANKSDLAQVALANQLAGEAMIKAKSFPEAIEKLNKGLEIYTQINHLIGASSCLYHLTRVSLNKKEFNNAIPFARRAAAIAQLAGDSRLEYQSRNLLSWANFESGQDFFMILENEYRQAHLVNTLNNDAAKAQVFNNLGYDLTVAGTVPLDSCVKLMTIANEIYAKQKGNHGLWYTLMNLTWQYRLMADYETSARFGKQSVDAAQSDGDPHAIIEACFQLAETLIAAGKVKEAEPYYNIALEAQKKANDRDRHVLNVYHARYLWIEGKKKEAINNLHQAIEHLKGREVFYEMHARALLADLYLGEGKATQAQEQLSFIENPRHNYIAFETRFLAACTRAKLLTAESRYSEAEGLLLALIDHSKSINAKQLVSAGQQSMERF